MGEKKSSNIFLKVLVSRAYRRNRAGSMVSPKDYVCDLTHFRCQASKEFTSLGFNPTKLELKPLEQGINPGCKG